MFYNYKVISFEGEKYFYPTKASLFKMIDEFGYGNFIRQFCNEFIMNEGNLIHSEVKVYNYDDIYQNGYGYPKKSYRNGHFIIRNFADSIIDISDLAQDYVQSRELFPKKRNNTDSFSGSKHVSRSRCRRKQSGRLAEMSQNEMDIMDGYVKIRTGRKEIIDIDYYIDYYHDYRLACHKSWKSKKVDKQWNKHNKPQ